MINLTRKSSVIVKMLSPEDLSRRFENFRFSFESTNTFSNSESESLCSEAIKILKELNGCKQFKIGNGTACFKNVNNCLNTNIFSYLETSGGQSSYLYLNVFHFFNTSVN
jgi:hypothetical protein